MVDVTGINRHVECHAAALRGGCQGDGRGCVGVRNQARIRDDTGLVGCPGDVLAIGCGGQHQVCIDAFGDGDGGKGHVVGIRHHLLLREAAAIKACQAQRAIPSSCRQGMETLTGDVCANLYHPIAKDGHLLPIIRDGEIGGGIFRGPGVAGSTCRVGSPVIGIVEAAGTAICIAAHREAEIALCIEGEGERG